MSHMNLPLEVFGRVVAHRLKDAGIPHLYRVGDPCEATYSSLPDQRERPAEHSEKQHGLLLRSLRQ